MSSNMRRYHKRKALGEIRGDLWYPLAGMALSAIFLAFLGVQHLWSPAGIAYLLGGAILLSVAVALFRGKSWARWPGVIVFATLCIAGSVSLYRDGFDGDRLWKVFLTGIFALYLADSSTAELFRLAEEDLEDGPESSTAQG